MYAIILGTDLKSQSGKTHIFEMLHKLIEISEVDYIVIDH